MASSIIVPVRKAVIAGIKDALNDPKVAVTYGWTGGSDDKRREQIWTDRARSTHDPASLRAARVFRDERMEFVICVWVSDPTKAPEDVDERLMELGTVVEEFVADHKNGELLGIPAMNWLVMQGFEIQNRLMQTGAASLAEYTVRYQARLT